MDIKPKSKRGGARPNSGPKPKGSPSLSSLQVADMLKLAAARAKETRKTVSHILLDIIYSEIARDSDKIQAIKLWMDATQPKPTEGGQADKVLGPVLFLPEHRPPELRIVKSSVP